LQTFVEILRFSELMWK